MKNRVFMFLLLAGMISCSKKDLISTETHPPLPTQTTSSFVSSDTVTEQEELSGGRTYVTKKYWITSVSPVKENASVTITMNTTNVTKGTSIPYSVTGIDTNDISSGKLTGNFIIGANGKDSITYYIKADKKTEGAENLTIVAKTATLAISITDVSTDTVAVVAAQPVSFKLDTIPYSDIDIIAPMRGANTKDTYNNMINIPDLNKAAENLDDDHRYMWSDLQSSATPNFAKLDADLAINIKAGKRMRLGIMSVCSSCTGITMGYPATLHTAMQAESVKDWQYNGVWIPNWNSPSYLKYVEDFLLALAKHINEGSYNGIPYKNVVNAIDVRHHGNWGEWHTYPWRDAAVPAGTKATDASLQRIVNAYITAFPDTRLTMISATIWGEMSDAFASFAIQAKNNLGLLGFRKDNLARRSDYYQGEWEKNNRMSNGVSISKLILERYKVAPMFAEPLENSVLFNGQDYGDMENQVRLYHISQFSNGNNMNTSATTKANWVAAAKAAGYRINIYGGNVTPATTAGGSMQVAINWGNIGVAPVYENWDVWYELRSGSTVVWTGKSSFTPKLFLPGTKAVTDNFTPGVTGTFSLYMIIKDPTGYRKPFMLANKNRQADGSYKLTDVKL